MGLYEKYKDARDLAWKVLIEYSLFDFPINVKNLAEKLGIAVKKVKKLQQDCYSISFKLGDNYLIAYTDSGSEATNRFTIAHEIGHILMHGKLNETSEYWEEQANIFASRLLMPMIVINHFDIKSDTELSNIFGVSPEAAKIRYQRYIEIKKRNKFLLSSLEKKYYELFLENERRKK